MVPPRRPLFRYEPERHTPMMLDAADAIDDAA